MTDFTGNTSTPAAAEGTGRTMEDAAATATEKDAAVKAMAKAMADAAEDTGKDTATDAAIKADGRSHVVAPCIRFGHTAWLL